MQRINVVPLFNSDHVYTTRILGFQRTDIEDNTCKSTYIQPILEEVAEATPRIDASVDQESPIQVSPKFQLTFLVL